MDEISGTERGIIDMRGELVVTHEGGFLTSHEGAEFPMVGDAPYRHGVLCLDPEGRVVLVTTDMDFETLVGDILTESMLQEFLKDNDRLGVSDRR